MGMPEYVEEYFKVLDVAMKTVLLPYITEFQSRKSHNEVIVDLKFLPHLNAFNMILTTEEGTVKYHSIRLPTYVKEVIPVVAAEQPIVEFISKIKGSPLYPECRIGDSVVKTFDNSTILMNLMAVIMSLLLIAQDKTTLLSLLRSLKARRKSNCSFMKLKLF